jgi:L,D-transpeptidase catalytic domain
MKLFSKGSFVRIFTVSISVVLCCSSIVLASGESSTTSSTSTTTTIASSSTSATSNSSNTHVATAAETSLLYPARSLRFPPYTRANPPAVPKNSGFGRRVVYQNNLQWVWIVDGKNKVVRAMPVSGLRGVPNLGTYQVNSQSLRSYSLDLKDVWFNNMTRFALGPNGGNIGFHEIPTKYGKPLQTVEQLGTFQGSGCIRMAIEDAKLMYNFAKLGTKVVVVP